MHSSDCCSPQGQPALPRGANIWFASRRIVGVSALLTSASHPVGGLLLNNQPLREFRICHTP
ncbi:hypothetical protein EC34870_3430 [Escherichia coli 3.4870]|nr:hypothetical protein EC34870_3430 [Escherichia coli 3.4870]